MKEMEGFAYLASHDLRTPLRGIDGFCKALVEDYGNELDATGRDYLNRVRAVAQKMSDIIDAMLDLGNSWKFTSNATSLSGLIPIAHEQDFFSFKIGRRGDICILMGDTNFKVSLDQELLLVMEDQARWAINDNRTNLTEVPDYLDFIRIDNLERIEPKAVTMIH